MNLSNIATRRTGFIVGGFVLGAALCCIPFVLADSQGTSSKSGSAPPNVSKTTGSGTQYQTTVDRKTEGELSEDDFRQVSLLASRIVKHINSATEHLTDEEYENGKSEVESAQKLLKIVREMLPVTVINTVVKDATGKEVYRNTDRVQDDQIPIFEHMIAVEVVEPIADAKKDVAQLKGIRLSDADLLRTSVIVDLDYIERKLKRCQKLLADKPDDALAQMVLAQNTGIRFKADKEDNPLVEAQLALKVSQRMAENERFEAAKANLQIARNHLELYRGLVGKPANEQVRDLDKEIEKLVSEIEKPGAANEIGSFWDRLTGWFSKDAGQTRTTESEGGETDTVAGKDADAAKERVAKKDKK